MAMDLKEQAMRNAEAAQQAASTPSGCKSCERKGIALYPLRVAAVPDYLVNTGWKPTVPQQDTALTGGEYKYALRTLREGYIYVLLDKTIWQGYQVTPQGFLRMFNAYEMPEGGEVEPLSAACLNQNHDIRCSFINIDPKHTHAAVAFSSDPWPREVLEKYKQAGGPAPRFTRVAIAGGKTVTIEGEGRSLVVDPTLATLTRNVLEFATDSYPPFAEKDGRPGGAFGFHPRRAKDKLTALGNKVAQLQEQFHAPVNAIVLDDMLGVVQELNSGRLDVIQAMSGYINRKDNIHQKMISDAILQIKASTVDKMTHDPTIQGVYTPGYTTSYTASRETVVAQKIHSALSPLEDYYSETARAAFAQTWESTVGSYQQKKAAIWKDLDKAYASALWLAMLTNDYSPKTSIISWAAQLKTITACLQGSIDGCDTDRLSQGENQPQWAKWLTDPASPPFLALLGNPGTSSAVFSGSMIYSNVKAGLNSQDVSDYVNSNYYRSLAANLITSIAGAFSPLAAVLSEQAKGGVTRMLQAVAYVAQGEPMVTVFAGELTVREFQEILRSQLSPHGKSVWSSQGEANGRMTSVSGAEHWLQITDPVLLERKIPLRLATPLKNLSTPEARNAARKAGTSVNALQNTPLSQSGHLAKFPSLSPEVIDRSLMTGEIPLGEADMKLIARRQATIPENFHSGVIGMALAGILLVATYSNVETLKTSFAGDPQTEMALASGSLIVMASAVEIAGQSCAMTGVLKSGDYIIRAAGVIGGIAAIIDGIALGMKVWSALKSNDTTAALYYLGATAATTLAGGISVYFSMAGNFAFLGPVGICIALGVAAAVFVCLGNNSMSSPLERWLAHTCFGIPTERHDQKKAWDMNSQSDLQEAMKALHVIASGMSAQLGADYLAEMTGNTRALGNRLLAARVTLADCSPTGSDWLVELTALGTNGRRQLLARSASPSKLNGLNAPEPQSYEIAPALAMGELAPSVPSIKMASDTRLAETWSARADSTPYGLQLDGEFPLNTSLYSNAELMVTYWPDKTRQDDSLQLTTQLDS